MVDLEERVKEIEDQNSKLYTKIITNAKDQINPTFKSPTKQGYRTHGSLSSGIDRFERSSSPKRRLLVRTYEDEINEIIENKWKK